MTPYQQVSLYAPEAVSDILHFDTYADYLEWMTHR